MVSGAIWSDGKLQRTNEPVNDPRLLPPSTPAGAVPSHRRIASEFVGPSFSGKLRVISYSPLPPQPLYSPRLPLSFSTADGGIELPLSFSTGDGEIELSVSMAICMYCVGLLLG